MRRFLVVLTLAVLAVRPPGASAQDAPPAAAPETLKLYVGEQKTLSVMDVNRVSVGDREIVDLRAMGGTEILVTGRKRGFTDLIFWDVTGKQRTIQIQVYLPVESLSRQLRDLLADVENLEVTAVGDQIVLDGRLLTKDDADRVKLISETFGQGQVVNLTVLDRGRQNELVENILAKEGGLGTVKIRIIGDTAFLTGHAYSKAQRDKIIALAQTQLPKVVDLIEVKDVMIEMDVVFLQVDKSAGAGIGQNLFDGNSVKLGASAQASGTGQNGIYTPFAVNVGWNADIRYALNLAVEKGNGLILSRPHLSTKSGEAGRFHSGGELYYKVEGQEEVDLKSVEYGMILEVTPELKSDDEIVSLISVEVSVPTSSAGSEDLNLQKFETKNTVSCRLGESMVISGFIETLQNYFQSKTPLLGDIPLLNLFFGRKARDKTDKELLTIITPRLLNAEDRPLAANRALHRPSLTTNLQENAHGAPDSR